jgi:hypothetical protein
LLLRLAAGEQPWQELASRVYIFRKHILMISALVSANAVSMVGPSVGIFLGGSTEWLKLSHPPLPARETGLNTNRKTGKGTNEKMRKLWKKKQGGAARNVLLHSD